MLETAPTAAGVGIAPGKWADVWGMSAPLKWPESSGKCAALAVLRRRGDRLENFCVCATTLLLAVTARFAVGVGRGANESEIMATVTHDSAAMQRDSLAHRAVDEAPKRLNHPPLVRLLQRAYSAEMAASLAYIGHANSLRNPAEKAAIKQIEDDEWAHRRHVHAIMQQYAVPVSRWFELPYFVIGKFIGASCHVIGWFMPYFFAGKLESGNVCEYFVMLRYFRSLGIRDHDAILYEMGMKEKEHELYFLAQVQRSRLLPWFERVFSWGRSQARNDVDFDAKYAIDDGHLYCAHHGRGIGPTDPLPQNDVAR